MGKLKIVTQTDNVEASGMMDDCAWATLACVSNFLLGSELRSEDGINIGEMVGRHDRENKGDGSSLAQVGKGAKLIGLVPEKPKSWADVVNALKAGHAIGISVQQPKGYPVHVKMSKWHAAWIKANPGKSYGHITCAADMDGVVAQWADPTMTGKGKEKFAVPVTYADLKAIASSHGDAPHLRCLIFKRPEIKTPVRRRNV
jgi:hypothetical protein